MIFHLATINEVVTQYIMCQPDIFLLNNIVISQITKTKWLFSFCGIKTLQLEKLVCDRDKFDGF